MTKGSLDGVADCERPTSTETPTDRASLAFKNQGKNQARRKKRKKQAREWWKDDIRRYERYTQCNHHHNHADTQFHAPRVAPRDRKVYVSASLSGLFAVADTMVYVPITYCE